MTFDGHSDSQIKYGDLVLVWMTRSQIKGIELKKGEILNTRYGAFPHDEMVKLKYGSQMPSFSSKGGGFVHLLAPTPELWAMTLSHRTQIVYTPDASYIATRLRIRPGSRVIESGTGSAALTHALARSVSRKGHVYTFEFHEPRFLEAKKELEEHSVSNVTISHSDVCVEGFSCKVDHPINANAVFLDLPSPWAAIPNLESAIDRTRPVYLCTFSPCIEQVIRTVEVMKREGWQRIEMVEVAAKRWEAHKEMVRTLDQALDVLRDVKVRRVEGLKKRKRELDGESEMEGVDNESTKPYNPWGRGQHVREGDEKFQWRDVSKVETPIKSHTSYLTFAMKPVPFESEDQN